jgi:hypothetical protein
MTFLLCAHRDCIATIAPSGCSLCVAKAWIPAFSGMTKNIPAPFDKTDFLSKIILRALVVRKWLSRSEM